MRNAPRKNYRTTGFNLTNKIQLNLKFFFGIIFIGLKFIRDTLHE